MKVLNSSDEFMAEMDAMFGSQPKAFRPSATYIPAGDCIEFVAKPGRYHAQRLDDLVTLYLSEADGEIVGSLVKGVGQLCKQITEKYPEFMSDIDNGRVRLEHLFLAHLWSGPARSKVVRRTYKKLIDVAEETKVEAELCLV